MNVMSFMYVKFVITVNMVLGMFFPDDEGNIVDDQLIEIQAINVIAPGASAMGFENKLKRNMYLINLKKEETTEFAILHWLWYLTPNLHRMIVKGDSIEIIADFPDGYSLHPHAKISEL